MKSLAGNEGTSDVDAYLAKVPEPARSTLERVRAVVRSAVPKGATELLSYGMPAFRHNGRTVVAYGAFKNHCSFFPMQASLTDAMMDELKNYRTSKGTLQFPVDKPLPAGLLKKMVKARLAENDIRARAAKR
jgi:uncharacterized protein YdhG (YjbR/CyaY superfamily)